MNDAEGELVMSASAGLEFLHLSSNPELLQPETLPYLQSSSI